MEKSNELKITHLFNAPKEVVFKAWTDPDQLKHWYAPEGCSIEFKSLTAEVGGNFHSCIHDPIHGDCWIKGIYQEVIRPEKLVFTMTLSNEQGEIVTADAASKPEDWPQTIITTVTFDAVGNQTKVTLHQTVDENEAKKSGAYQSWFSMFDKLQLVVGTE